LIGQCLGDALGFVVEGYPPQMCAQYVERVWKTGQVDLYSRKPFPFGQYSDDSQLARELLQSYVACKQFRPSDYAARIAAIFMENRIVGRGRATEEAAYRLAQGISWEDAGTPPPSAGNGSAMRAGPIGLIFFDNPPQLIQAAHDQGRITHQDRRCSAGAVAIAGAVALSLQNMPIQPSEFLSQLASWARVINSTMAEGLELLMDWISLPPDSAVGLIARFGLDSDYMDVWQGISPFVISSVLWSLYSFLRTPNDYWETIGTAIIVGGDVDTTAAMAGAISGAYLGLEKIPLSLAQHLTDQGTWGFTELVQLASQCYSIKMQG
jgi:ADP-ribosylglycohydrolase